MITVSWIVFKQFIDSRQLFIQYVDVGDNYYLSAFDGQFCLGMCIPKVENPEEGSPQKEFEDNYKDNANQRLSQFDTDGANIVRIKAAKKGWSFWACPPEIITSTLGGTLYCKDAAGTDIPGIYCKIYDSDNIEITTAGDENINLTTCVKTILDIEHPFDTELIGGSLRIHSTPSEDLRLWIVGAPDIPAIYGGSKEFVSGINLKFLAPDNSFEIDGRVTKYITYNNVNHSGKIRIILKHSAGLTVNLQLVIHLYRL